ncbi:MAG: hypothetical protein JXQ87_12885 [Bacteroidia bacterium]
MKSYLSKHAFTDSIISDPANEDLGIFIVVPVYKEKSILPIFKSLQIQSRPTCKVEVLFVFNASEIESDLNISINEIAKEELDKEISNLESNEVISFFTCEFNNLPKKHAGVGLARKIGMDEAVRRFEQIGIDGLIVNIDADCTVSENYLVEIEKHFQSQKTDGCGIYFEHPLDNEDQEINDAIIQYELYLRYYVNMQRIIGFPWAFQTIGSAMAVKSSVYQKQGGMNKRKAGEDFYFLQKIIELGNFSELNSATVYASARKSDRVPFGTGKAVSDIIESDTPYGFYNPKSFYLLKEFFGLIPLLHQTEQNDIETILNELDFELNAFLIENNWIQKINQVKNFTSDLSSFRKRLFREFNAFQLMKYLHYMRDVHAENINVNAAVDHLFPLLGLRIENSLENNLKSLREYDKKSEYKY